MGKFSLGQTVMTSGVAAYLEENNLDHNALGMFIYRHENGDWGDLPEEDKEANEQALIDNDRILSKYKLNEEVYIYIVTEWDRSYTTVMLAEEY